MRPLPIRNQRSRLLQASTRRNRCRCSRWKSVSCLPLSTHRIHNMTISMYQASVPRFVNILGNLSNILDKAQAHVDAKKLDPSALPTYRLFPDMLPMTTQVQIACDTAKGVVARLAGMEIPAFEDNEKTLAELKARIAKTIAFIQTVTAAQIDGSEEKEI